MTRSIAKVAEKSPLSGSIVLADLRYVWVFQCSTRLALHATTIDRRARNLPKNVCHGGEWTLTGQPVVGLKNAPMAGIDVEAHIAGIKKDGYYTMKHGHEAATAQASADAIIRADLSDIRRHLAL